MNPTFLFFVKESESHLPFSHCEKLIRDQIKNLFGIERQKAEGKYHIERWWHKNGNPFLVSFFFFSPWCVTVIKEINNIFDIFLLRKIMGQKAKSVLSETMTNDFVRGAEWSGKSLKHIPYSRGNIFKCGFKLRICLPKDLNILHHTPWMWKEAQWKLRAQTKMLASARGREYQMEQSSLRSSCYKRHNLTNLSLLECFIHIMLVLCEFNVHRRDGNKINVFWKYIFM